MKKAVREARDALARAGASERTIDKFLRECQGAIPSVVAQLVRDYLSRVERVKPVPPAPKRGGRPQGVRNKPAPPTSAYLATTPHERLDCLNFLDCLEAQIKKQHEHAQLHGWMRTPPSMLDVNCQGCQKFTEVVGVER